MTVRKWFLKLQEEIEASQGLQGIFDCRIETKIMFPPLPPPPPPSPSWVLYRIVIINNNNNLHFPQNKAEINWNESKQIKSFRDLNAVFQYYPQTKSLEESEVFFFAMAPLRADQAQKLRKICNVLRLINAKSGEGKRLKEFAEWHVAWRAEWHNYAKYDLRGE